MNSCSDVMIDLEYRAWLADLEYRAWLADPEYRAWLADPEGYEAEQAELRRWHDDSDVIRQWMEETEQERGDMAGNCGQCGGTGKVDSGAPTPWGDYYEVGCPSCGGSGEEFQYWENLRIHRDDDDGAECILEAEYISGAAHVVVIRAGSEPLDINQVRQLRDWLNEVLDEYADEWNERLAAGFGGA